jgi:GTPase SAR1 family protein
MIVYDITSERSFQKVKYWIKELSDKISADGDQKILIIIYYNIDFILLIIGNKIDLDDFNQR